MSDDLNNLQGKGKPSEAKRPNFGELIKRLRIDLDKVSKTVDTIQGLGGQVTGLDTRVNTLQTQVTNLTSTIGPITTSPAWKQYLTKGDTFLTKAQAHPFTNTGERLIDEGIDLNRQFAKELEPAVGSKDAPVNIQNAVKALQSQVRTNITILGNRKTDYGSVSSAPGFDTKKYDTAIKTAIQAQLNLLSQDLKRLL